LTILNSFPPSRLGGVVGVQFGVIAQMTSLTQRRQVASLIVSHVVVKVRHGQHHPRSGHGMRLAVLRTTPLAGVPARCKIAARMSLQLAG